MENIEYYFGLVCMVAYALTHVVANLPVSVTSKIPDWIMIIVNFLAANYNQTGNAKTDMKGNSNEGSSGNSANT